MPRHINPYWNRPLAGPGLTSYRYRTYLGWVMIGATDDADALKEAARSVDFPIDPSKLQKWNGKEYAPCPPALS